MACGVNYQTGGAACGRGFWCRSPRTPEQIQPDFAQAAKDANILLSNGGNSRKVLVRALLPVTSLDARKISISYLSADAAGTTFLGRGCSRRYTVTHNDITAQIHISIGEDYNQQQISGWYTKLVRDEVCAEWHFSERPSLHLYCHVSGASAWLAPARARSYIFAREMPLVLDTIAYAERSLFATCSHLRTAALVVHFEAEEEDLARAEYWGMLGEWIDRKDGPVEAHLQRVARTTLPSRPSTRFLPPPLHKPCAHLLNALTEELVEEPRRSTAIEEARAALLHSHPTGASKDTNRLSRDEEPCSHPVLGTLEQCGVDAEAVDAVAVPVCRKLPASVGARAESHR